MAGPGSGRGLSVIVWDGGAGTGSGTGIGAGGGWGWALMGEGVGLSWVAGSGWTGDGFGGTTGGWGSDCSQASLASCSTLLPSGSKPSKTAWSTWTSGTEDANGGVSVGRGSGPGGVSSALPPSGVVVGGFVVIAGRSGSLSFTGRDQGSIGSDRERTSRFLGRSGSEVEEDEAMSDR